MQFDKTTTDSTSCIFGIDSTLFIRSVNLNKLSGSIIFYIMSLNISYLIYLANMDKLGVFLNNITNQVIRLQTYIN